MKFNRILFVTLLTISLTLCFKYIYDSNNGLRIVMLGDSEIRRINHYWGPDTNWNTITGYNSIFNFGFDSYGSAKMLNDGGGISPLFAALRENPDVIFLMVGINDAHQNVPLSTTLENIKTIIDTIQGRGIDLVIQSVLPTTNYYDTLYGGFKHNGILAIRAENMDNALQALCLEENVPFLDIRNGLVKEGNDGIKYLKNELSTFKGKPEGIHLNYEGYMIWKSHLKKYIRDTYSIE